MKKVATKGMKMTPTKISIGKPMGGMAKMSPAKIQARKRTRISNVANKVMGSSMSKPHAYNPLGGYQKMMRQKGSKFGIGWGP